MSSSLVFGRHSSRISFAFSMLLVTDPTNLLLSLTTGMFFCAAALSCDLCRASWVLTSYRQFSTFGHGTIRKFAANSSEMKKLAARDFEDLLQVLSLPSPSRLPF